MFRDMAIQLYESSNLVEFNENGKLIYSNGYCKVIDKLLTVKNYNLMVKGCSLEETGFIMNVTRERIRQTVTGAIGQFGSKRYIGKIRSPASLLPRQTVREKLNILNDLKDSLKLLYG